jgi:hypothetical protein
MGNRTNNENALRAEGWSRAVGIAFLRSRYYAASMITITCKIPESLDAELEAVAERRGVSKSVVVRESIEASLPDQKQLAGLSAFDVMKEACGIIKRGPRDLATHPKHMKGFGRD